MPYLKSGGFKMIGVGNYARQKYAPETQSCVEQGYNAYVDLYWCMAMTAGTDPGAIAAAVAVAVKSDTVAEIVADVASSSPLTLGPEGTKKC